MATAYIGLGSNIGDRIDIIKKSLEIINNTPNIEVKKISSFYETEPMEYKNQDWFVNAVAEINTELTPEELLEKLNEIEIEIERIRTIKWGPRNIDIDILYYEQELVATSELQIPHIRMNSRAFVLIPLAEIAENVKHPILNKTPMEMYDMLYSPSKVRKLELAS
jgi:2-amino-4-hydroxy-6-hydroxymethyldihydropteridine diphosphokinase